MISDASKMLFFYEVTKHFLFFLATKTFFLATFFFHTARKKILRQESDCLVTMSRKHFHGIRKHFCE